MTLLRFRFGLAASLLALLQWGPACAATVGEVTFAAGDARLEGATAKLLRGAQVEVGQTIVTGSGGHVHIKFVDDAFVAVRPNSQLTVDDYQYDPANAAANRVKFTLRGGTGRLITGKAGQANKQGFRLNTPMAAIGVRGTDFVVRASADSTRVTVQQGAVVMSPFADGCSAAGSGPCGGALARQLSASLSGSYLEQRDQAAPTLIKVDPAKLRELFAPARSEEPAAKAAASLIDPLPPASSGVVSPARAAPDGFVGSANIFWGRWDPASHGSLFAAGSYEILAQSGSFVLVRPADRDSLLLPGDGRVSFRLADSKLLLREAGALVRAEAVDPSLVVNFGSKTFDTAITLRAGTQTDVIRGRGAVTEDGRFVVNESRSNADVKGGLSNSGTEAGYLFVRRGIEGDTNAIGVTRWSR
jgi:hypothetical protein